MQLELDRFEIIGLVENTLKEAPYQAVRPAFYTINYQQGEILTAKLNPDYAANRAMTQIESSIHKYVPEAVVEFSFVDEEYSRKFEKEQRFGQLSFVFAALAIFISCLGLFGLSAYVVEQRTKEIGIRKVLGASVTELWHLLSKDFTGLVIISCLLAIPAAYYFSSLWLENYDYRINISGWVLALAGVGALVVTLTTVSFQTIKAAIANPLKSLRSE